VIPRCILSTSRLFVALLRPLGIAVVCDVGSLNGADALRFRRRLPDARVLAFEPNPANLARMRGSRVLREAAIEVLPYAAAAVDAQACFYVVPVHHEESLARQGMSSLHQRSDADKRGVPVTVETRRLDTVLDAHCLAGAAIALWVDAEGTAFEVLQGARGILDQVWLIHVEVETTPCIGAEQRLHRDVEQLLRQQGFLEIATDGPPEREQFNALYVRNQLPAATRRALARYVRWHRLRRRCVDAFLAHCPPRIRGWLYRRRQIPRTVSA
jgi:FkbM family methyltransferase